MSVCHRCIDCPQRVQHELEDVCPSCGRCEEHCQQDNHQQMKPTEEYHAGFQLQPGSNG